MIRILVVDDQALVRSGFHLILDSEPDFEVVGEAADGQEAIDLTRRLRPDVVLMDVRMPRMDGVEATRTVVADGASRVLILTTDDLALAVRAVARGDALIEPRMTRRLLEEFARQPSADRAPRTPAGVGEQLTARELEVFQAVARGHSNAEIAEELYISETTVKTHVAHILTKLDLRDRIQAVVLAYESGLLPPGG